VSAAFDANRLNSSLKSCIQGTPSSAFAGLLFVGRSRYNDIVRRCGLTSV